MLVPKLTKQRVATLFLFLIVTLSTALCAEATPKNGYPFSYQAHVIRVVDGDTIHVKDRHGQRHKIRLAFIDAPEINQAYGLKSKNNLVLWLHEKPINVKVYARDRYQREIAQIFKQNTDINLQQIKAGAAWHYHYYAAQYQNMDEYTQYLSEEAHAQEARLGLWQQKKPIMPWRYRHKNTPKKHE